MTELDQFEALNVLSLDCDNTRIGSGGYGYTSQLPGGEFDPAHVRPRNMWGCSNAQIFSEVSPQMHWEFALQHDLRWLARWGLTYYGCCEPLDRKIDILRRIPNLRKISVSPWCNTAAAVAKIGGDYVISRKPSPAILAEDRWHPERARQDLCEFLDAARGLPRRVDHEGHFHGPLPAAAAVGVGPDRHGSGRGARKRRSHFLDVIIELDSKQANAEGVRGDFVTAKSGDTSSGRGRGVRRKVSGCVLFHLGVGCTQCGSG